MGSYFLGQWFSVWLGHWTNSCNCRVTGGGRKRTFPSSGSVQLHLMRCNVQLYSQLLPLALCRRGGGISTWHLPQFSIFQNGISRRIGEVHCLMDQIFLSSTLSLLLVLAIDVSLCWKEKMFKNKFCCVLYWNSAKPSLENLCEGQRESCKWTYNNWGGQGFQAFVPKAGRRRCLTCISCYPISYCSGRAQKSVDCSWRQPVRWAHCWQLVVQRTGYNDVQDLWI